MTASSDIFGLLDAARDPRIYPLIQHTLDHECLFAGDLHDEVEAAAPYLVRLRRNEPLWSAWRNHGWGHSWGIMCRSPASLGDLRRQFRRLLQVMLPDGEVVLFRFYDPRVWRSYLPTCAPDELRRWFAVVDEYRCEQESGRGVIGYREQGGVLYPRTLQ